MVNRTVVRLLHDAVYPSNTVESPATSKLRSILKTPEVTKILQGEKLPTESKWAVHPWLMPAVHMYGRLAYKFEGMTDMIKGVLAEVLALRWDTSVLTERANLHAAPLLRRIAQGIILSSKRYQHTHIPSMLESKVPFAFARTRYARFCGVRICLAVFGLMRYFIALMPTGPTPAVIPRGKSSTIWGLTPSVIILNVTGMFLALM